MYARGRLRVDECIGEARALRGEVEDWRSRWELIDAIGTHLSQLDVLTATVLGLVRAIEDRTAAIDPAAGTGAVYERCRADDQRLLHARRLWRWYADKIDQRDGPEDAARQTLRAADEVIWSCWKTAFTALGETVPAAPIAYLAPQFSAFATPRTDPPPELRPGMDDLLREHIERLPVAAIGLPPVCVRRPWWIIVSAHEASHHVQFESTGIEQLTQEKVVAAAYAASADVGLAESWRPWCRELFADACSVLLVGPAATWAVTELELRSAAGMRRSPSGGYPPPVVRLAALRAAAELAGLPAGAPGGPCDQDVPAEAGSGPDDDDHLKRLLGCADAVAAALLDVTSAAGRPVRSLGAATAAAYAEGGSVAGWRQELAGADEPVPLETLDAARFCAAAGVDTWQRYAGRDGHDQLAGRLGSRLRALLPACREPGTRADAAPPDPGQVIRQLVTDLYAQDGRT